MPNAKIKKWEMPEVDLTDRVIVMSDCSPGARKQAAGGFVSEIGRRAISVHKLMSGGTRVLRGLHHVDDPLLLERPNLIEEGEGVWDFAASTKLLKATAAKVDQIDKLLAKSIAASNGRGRRAKEPDEKPGTTPADTQTPEPVET